MFFDFSYKLNSDEKLAGLVRKHWFFLAAPAAESLIIIALLAVFVNKILIFRQSALISLILALIYAIYLIYKWVLWRADFYVITSERVIKISQGGFWDRTLGEASLRDIRDVFWETRGLSATLLKFGTVKVLLKSGRIFKMENISRPAAIYQAIVKLKEV